MSGLSIVLALLTTSQEPKPADPPADRVKRAAVVDGIINDQRKAVIRLNPAFEPAPPQVLIRKSATGKESRLLTLEHKAANPAPVGQVLGLRIQEMALAGDNFDRWLFDDTRTAEGRRDHLGSKLAEKLHEVSRSDRTIEPDQLPKLRLAGQGDIKRFLDRTEAARAEFEVARQDYSAGRVALGHLEPLAYEYQAGPFGAGSCFEKVLRKLVLEREVASRGGK